MDLDFLIILLFFVLPVISRILGGLRKKKQTAAPPTDAEPAQNESLFNRAIREIEAALEEAEGGQKRTREPEPDHAQREVVTAPRRPKRVKRAKRTKVVRQDQFHDHEPGSFESRQYTEFHELTPVKIDETLFASFDSVKKKENASRKRVRKQLANRRSARDSFLLTEIFGKPHSLKRK